MVYVVIVYDINVDRVNKVRIFLKQYLDWMQNSVFEGEITKAKLREVELGLNSLIKKDEDSIIIYSVRDRALLKEKFIGEPKVEPSNIL